MKRRSRLAMAAASERNETFRLEHKRLDMIITKMERPGRDIPPVSL